MGLWSLQIFHGIWGEKNKTKTFVWRKNNILNLGQNRLKWIDSLILVPLPLICFATQNLSPATIIPTPALSHTPTHTQAILLCQLTFRRLTSNLPKGIPAPIHPQPLPRPPASLSVSLPAAPALWILAQQVAPLQSPLGIRGLSGVPESCNYTTTQVI